MVANLPIRNNIKSEVEVIKFRIAKVTLREHTHFEIDGRNWLGFRQKVTFTELHWGGSCKFPLYFKSVEEAEDWIQNNITLPRPGAIRTIVKEVFV